MAGHTGTRREKLEIDELNPKGRKKSLQMYWRMVTRVKTEIVTRVKRKPEIHPQMIRKKDRTNQI